MSRKPLLRSLLLASGLLCSFLAQAEDWELVRDKNDIQVFNQEVDGSKFKRTKAVTRVKADIATLVNFLQDSENFPKWMWGARDTKALKNFSRSERLTYSVTNVAWPQKDRDTIIHSKWERDSKSQVLRQVYSAEPGYLPSDSNLQRVTRQEGEWRLRPVGNGEVEVTFISFVDMGRDAPKWLVQQMAMDMPFESLRRMREAPKDRYRNGALELIQQIPEQAIVDSTRS